MFEYKANADVRERIAQARLRHWQVADKLGISEYTFVKWMRTELSAERRALVLQAVKELVAERKR